MGVVTIPPPFGGLNYLEALLNTQIPYAVYLDNWIPRKSFCEIRKGTQPYTASPSAVSGGAIRTLAPHPGGNVVVGNGTRLDVYATSTTSYPGVSVTGLTVTSGLWNYTQHSNKIILTNGVDTPRVYDGSTFTTLTVTGPTATSLWGCQSIKGRCFYWYQNAQSFWYCAAASFQGTMTEYKLDQFLIRDSKLIAVAPLTVDGGQGADDMIAFLFSSGEVLLYQGDDPGSATAWQQVGRFNIPIPMGPQCWTISGSATLVATQSGLVDLAKALQAGAIDQSSSIGLGSAGSGPTSASVSQLALVPNERFLVQVKYAGTPHAAAEIMVMDVDSRAWCTFSFQDGSTPDGGFITSLVTCIAQVQGGLYFGGADGIIYIYSGGFDKIDGNTARGIYAQATGAFSGLGADTTLKQITGYSLSTDAVADASLNLGYCRFASTKDLDSTGSQELSYLAANQLAANSQWRSFGQSGYRFAVGLSLLLSSSYAGSVIRWYGTKLMLRAGGER